MLLKSIDSGTDSVIMYILTCLNYLLWTIFFLFLTVYEKRWSISERGHLCLLNFCRSGMDHFHFLQVYLNFQPTIMVLMTLLFFSHGGFLLRHSTLRMSCVWVGILGITCSTFLRSLFYLGWLGNHSWFVITRGLNICCYTDCNCFPQLVAIN